MRRADAQTTRIDQDEATERPVPLLDLARVHEPLQDQLQAAIACVCQSGRFINGPDCQRLEAAIARVCAADHAVGCASGSDALLLALMAAGVGPGDEVILPSFTFFATAGAVWRLGARPVFVDIEPASFNIDPQQVETALTPATRAILPVHLFGQCAEMEPLCRIAETNSLIVIEDAAQAIGAGYQGRPAGSLGQVGCFSFYPTKNLGGMGDGGMLTTSDGELAERLRLLRAHGMQPRYHHRQAGINSRLDSLQAAVLGVKLPYLARWTIDRQRNARRYTEMLSDASLAGAVGLPRALADREHVWNQYTIRVGHGRRDPLRDHLAAAGIGTEIYYPVPLHRQECFAHLDYAEGSLPETEKAAGEVLSLPIYPGLTEAEQRVVVARISEFFESRRSGDEHWPPRPNYLDRAAQPGQRGR